MEIEVPPNFRSVVADFTNDLSVTYSDYSYLWSKWNDPELSDEELKYLFEYCLKIYPERFFDIIYQNDEMFQPESEINIYFLPNVSFRLLFNCEDVTENTKKTMWKYLQLLLFTIIGGIKDKSTFGDTLNLFQGIDEGDLQDKLKETMSGMTDFFSKMEQSKSTQETAGENEQGTSQGTSEGTSDSTDPNEHFKNMFENMTNGFSGTNGANIPNMSNIQDHLKQLFDGKIGKLAKEMAEELSGEFTNLVGEDVKNATNTQDVIKLLMKNPKKIMDLMKKVGGKLDSKMKNGDISREELMKEAGDILGKMKDMGGQEQFTEMFKNMAKNMGMGKNVKLDTNALDRLTKQSSMRDKIKSKMELKKQMQAEEIEKKKEEIRQRIEAQQKIAANYSLDTTETPNNFVFRLDGEEPQEKSSVNSFIHPDLLKDESNDQVTSTKKKKNKKKK
uniref:Uncharacterized protein n=1 Tax=viral metagenome TaxID=1070528 RepID=A0A6C0JGJ8_9ZZZZ